MMAGGADRTVVGIAGSLRRESLNRALLRAAAALAPAGLEIVEHDLIDIPLFNQDVEERGDPPAVTDLKRAVAAADGVLIATPEYQHGVPGVLKNALDWLSRPPRGSVLQGKPVAIMGASPGMTGTARAQAQLRQALVYNGCPVLPPPEVLVARAHEAFDDGGALADEATRGFVAGALERFAGWIAVFEDPPTRSDG